MITHFKCIIEFQHNYDKTFCYPVELASWLHLYPCTSSLTCSLTSAIIVYFSKNIFNSFDLNSLVTRFFLIKLCNLTALCFGLLNFQIGNADALDCVSGRRGFLPRRCLSEELARRLRSGSGGRAS